MFWEFSSDRGSELIGLTHQQLNKGVVPTTAKPSGASSTPKTSKSTKPWGISSTPKASKSTKPTVSTDPSTPTAKIKSSTTASSGGQAAPWKVGVSYAVGNQVAYEGKVYKCIQPNTALDSWMPSAVPALWQVVN
ncbi:unnamed protein product [Didymodactylos carnosus]|uniref:Chitin-binding type-3 domain-containing protein n=1 Tax=Didymodactylos carnosus TaxID=1234261 RepID=A0A8S2S863_9BILA|nr:unnamed protein product [Didymodactylos carnosus]CAF4213619.1 unnamed protein product [Didymodactylos carnosus]